MTEVGAFWDRHASSRMARATVQDVPQALGAPGGPEPDRCLVGRSLASSRRDPRAWEAGRSRAPGNLTGSDSISTRREPAQVPVVLAEPGSVVVVVVVVGVVGVVVVVVVDVVVLVGGAVVVVVVVGGVVVE